MNGVRGKRVFIELWCVVDPRSWMLNDRFDHPTSLAASEVQFRARRSNRIDESLLVELCALPSASITRNPSGVTYLVADQQWAT